MSSKGDLQRELHEIGYELGPFTSKETLTNIRRLHSFVLTDKDINVAELNDLELRRSLTEHGLIVGPVTNHTRAIYQRRLLEVLTNEITEGEDESTINDENIFSYDSRKTYDQPITIRNDYKATRPPKDQNLDDVRSRFSTKPNQPQPINKIQVATKSSGTTFYASITLIVALIVFILYLWLTK